jgi:hypothetical protein
MGLFSGIPTPKFRSLATYRDQPQETQQAIKIGGANRRIVDPDGAANPLAKIGQIPFSFNVAIRALKAIAFSG